MRCQQSTELEALAVVMWNQWLHVDELIGVNFLQIVWGGAHGPFLPLPSLSSLPLPSPLLPSPSLPPLSLEVGPLKSS